MQHHFRGLDHGGDGVADLEVHFFRAAPSDDALHDVAAHFDRHVGHDVSQLQLGYFANQMIARRYSHARNCKPTAADLSSKANRRAPLFLASVMGVTQGAQYVPGSL